MGRQIETIETVKRRLIKSASRIWGYSEPGDISSFDPVLGLLLGALAEELMMISTEIDDADSRVLEKFLNILFSGNLFTHFPAHAVATAKPLMAQAEINEYFQFCFSKEVQKSEGGINATERKDLWFTPLDSCHIFNADIKYLFSGSYLYEFDGKIMDPVMERKREIPENRSKIYIGIKLDARIKKLDGLSLYFSLRNMTNGSSLLQSIQNASWKLNGTPITFLKGFNESGSNFSSEDHDRHDSLIDRAMLFIKGLYKKHFITLPFDDIVIDDYPLTGDSLDYLRRSFPNEQAKLLSGEYFWLEGDLLRAPDRDEINDLVLSLNCFPVFNRELNELTSTLQRGRNIIALHTDDMFLEVDNVTNSRGLPYKPSGQIEDKRSVGGSYLIRQGGVARFDSRDAKRAMSNLTDLLRDEAAAFSMKGGDLISYELKQLDQIIARIEQRIGSSSEPDDQKTYLIINSEVDYERINIQYWSMAGDSANGIRPGTRLVTWKGSDIDDRSIALMSSTLGGKHALTNDEKLNLLRRSLLSKGRVVTGEDIKALCFELFSQHLKGVEIKKGVIFDELQGGGFVKTVDIHLQMNKELAISEEEIKYRVESLKVRLALESANLLPYRVFVR